MPSNHIYELCEDNDGFLWIPTDNGVSRFDGTRFVNYSTKDGLPSNDVLQIVKSNDGTIWANCYKQPPSYFDSKLNIFISFENNNQILKISSSFLEITNLPKEGIIFQNGIGCIKFYGDKKPVAIVNDNSRVFIYNDKELYVKLNYSKVKNGYNTIFSFSDKNNNAVGNLKINSVNALAKAFWNQDVFYIYDGDLVKKITITNLKPFTVTTEVVAVHEKIKWLTIKENYINVISKSGNIYIVDKNNLKIKFKINNTISCSNALLDKYDNVWASTEDKGLLYFNTSQIKQVFGKENFSNNFISVLKSDKYLYAGNLKGQIIDRSKKKTTIHNLSEDQTSFWVRNIFDFNKKIVSISDVGYTINFKKTFTIFNKLNSPISLKTAEKLNDSILIIGSTTGSFKLNVLTEKYEDLNCPSERILVIKKIDDHSFYFLSNDGILKYNLVDRTFKLVIKNENIKNDRINKFQLDENKNLWISTVKGSLLFYKNGKIILNIDNSVGLPDNVTDLYALENKLWVTSKSGLYIVDYSDLNSCKIKKIPKFEGLTSAELNAISYKNDTLYLATNNGISVVPKNFQFSKFEIKPFVISVKINNKNVPLSTKYDLKKEEKNSIIQLAGIDLSGHFKNFQYSINNQKDWIDLEGNILNLLLKDGQNDIFIRAVDVNNNVSSKKIYLKFNVAIPAYNTLWFWLIIAFGFIGFGFRQFNRRKFLKQKRTFQQKLALESQRNKITADLHDDLGAALSSLQINSLIASKLMAKKPDEARKILSQIEKQSQKISENIGDIIWSLKPGKDELMTLTTRIKNFATEILGNTNINYTFDLDESIDTEITDFTIRKNIVLITKEALNNCAKYSKAKNIYVKISKEQHAFLLTIFDDGIQFDTHTNKGNGIANMTRRAEEIKAKFSQISCKGKNQLFLAIPIIREEK